ncbi:MAG: site-specific integrase [Hyphomonadaceae bacterium]|nr:site-specific integrase [Hyphomonadaceae bacterium]
MAAGGEDPKAGLATKTRTRDVTMIIASKKYLHWCATNNSPKSLESKRSAFNVHLLPAWGKQPIGDINRKAIAELLDDLDDRPAMRRQLYLYLNHFFSWCVEREFVETNPAGDLKPPKPGASRERVLADSEIAALWNQTGAMATIAKLCVLTAQRKGSVEAMRWDKIDFVRKIWTVPGANMKSGKLHTVPLCASAMTLIQGWPRRKGPYLFGVGSDGEKPYAGSSNGMEGLRRELGNPDWRLHDLRRTAVTLAQRAGCNLDAIRALTQHKTNGVIGVYTQHKFQPEKCDVVQAIEAQVRQCCTQVHNNA